MEGFMYLDLSTKDPDQEATKATLHPGASSPFLILNYIGGPSSFRGKSRFQEI